MPTAVIIIAANPAGYALYSTQTLADATALAMIQAGQARASDTVTPQTPSALEALKDLAAEPLTAAQLANVQGFVSGAGIVAAGPTRRAMQDALNANALTLSSGSGVGSECLLIGSNTTVSVSRQASISAGGTYFHTMLRTGNAEYSAASLPIFGTSIFCADAVAASGTGTLRYTQATQSLAWSGPAGAFGAEVIISAVIDVSTLRVVRVASASGHGIYVMVWPNASRVADASKTVILEPVTGANSVAWSRDATTRTVTEAAHGRQVGDFVSLLGSSVMELYGYVTAITASTWTIADTAGAGSGSSWVYGVRNITLDIQGALDARWTALSDAGDGMQTHGVVLHSCSDVAIRSAVVRNCKKYALLVTGFHNVQAFNVVGGRDVSSGVTGNADVFHVNGPGRAIHLIGCKAQGGDNLTAVGTGDIAPYVFFLPAYGDPSVEDYTFEGLYGNNSSKELFRAYTANAGWLRRGRVSRMSGTYDTTTSGCGQVMTDATTLMTDAGATNIDGLIIDGPNAVRSDGSESAAFRFTGSGTRRALKITNLQPRAMGSALSGSVQVGCTLEDLEVELLPGAAFAGAQVSITTAGYIKRFKGYSKAITGNNALISGSPRAIFLQLETATSQADAIEIVVGAADDVSASGNKLSVLYSNGIVGAADVKVISATAAVDSAIRSTATAPAGGVYKLCAVNALGAIGAYFDNAPAKLLVSDSVFPNGGPIQCSNTAGSSWVQISNTWAGNRLFKVGAGSGTFRLQFSNSEGAAGGILVAAGTPALRLQGQCSVGELGIDGALLDATVTNHAPGTSFYNTNAAFSAGIGAYVRGATTWTRVAA